MEEFKQRLACAEITIRRFDDYHMRHDLLRLFETCNNIYTKLTQEAITCRRIHKPTIKYNELAIQLDETLRHLEQNITFATLII